MISFPLAFIIAVTLLDILSIKFWHITGSILPPFFCALFHNSKISSSGYLYVFSFIFKCSHRFLRGFISRDCADHTRTFISWSWNQLFGLFTIMLKVIIWLKNKFIIIFDAGLEFGFQNHNVKVCLYSSINLACISNSLLHHTSPYHYITPFKLHYSLHWPITQTLSCEFLYNISTIWVKMIYFGYICIDNLLSILYSLVLMSHSPMIFTLPIVCVFKKYFTTALISALFKCWQTFLVERGSLMMLASGFEIWAALSALLE